MKFATDRVQHVDEDNYNILMLNSNKVVENLEIIVECKYKDDYRYIYHQWHNTFTFLHTVGGKGMMKGKK